MSHAQEMTNVVLHAAQSAGTFTHAADSSASFALQVRPLAWGVPLEWGPVALVTPLRGDGFADWAGSTYADPFADDVGDGVSNLLAYALGAAGRSVVDTGQTETGAQFYRLEVHLAEP